MLKKYLLSGLLLVVIIALNAMRFVNLDGVPNGFHIDEQVSGVALACLAQDGSDPLGKTHWPVFGENSFSTPSPPTYMYPGIVWVKAFGFSPASMRALTVFSFMLALLGLFAIGRHLGGVRCGLWVLLAGSISPWTWILTRVAWESLFILPFLVWGVFWCLRGKKILHFIFAGMLLSCAAYSYPPGRLQVPLLMILLGIYGFWRLKWTIPQILALGAAFILTSTPLIILYVTNPTLSARFKELSITNPEFLKSIGSSGAILDLVQVVIRNFLVHLHPTYLLFKGNPSNLTLTTGQQGIMSWLDVIAVLAGTIWAIRACAQKQPPASASTVFLFLMLLAAIIIGIFPTTLTTTDNPHALRTIGAWPFAMIATGLILHKMTAKTEWAAWPLLAAAVIFMTVYLKQYFVDYAKTSRGWFSAWTLAEAKNAKTDQQWMEFLYRYHYHMFLSRYYLMRYHNNTCAEARTIWQKLYPVFDKLHQQNDPKKP